MLRYAILLGAVLLVVLAFLIVYGPLQELYLCSIGVQSPTNPGCR